MKKIIIASYLLGALGIISFWGDKRFGYLFFFCVLAVILRRIEKFRNNKKKPEKPDQQAVSVDLTHYYLTIYLSLLNPYSLIQMIRQLSGQLYILVFYSFRLPSPASFHSKVEYILPFKGTWKVGRGGVTPETSHSWGLYTQRYAYDFFITDDHHKPNSGTGNQLEDYYCFDQEVIAPADGMIVGIKNNIRDYVHVGDLSVDWKTKDFRGNYVVIKHHENEYSFIAHFRKGSIVVKKGDIVKQGQLLGKCGNSGHSTMPHIHYHLQRSKYFWTALGLPVRFKNVVINGSDNHEQGEYISTDQQVSNLRINELIMP
ncbi:M23 family metallopeptidase [Chitinophaga sp. G-6-1-13]|uniref:M23 family metallopeptidase n=1 Tax=Chitinophaga fulva TaxID=2728842 RepID=A0A848GI56_9BACT|nr:M23 family metallopeptidase [Chitinophaga fulva]NML37906.1 M23 family metallopeptidase [Chitinophaga fulva]